MKSTWPVKTLGDVCEVLDSLRKPVTKRDRSSGVYPYYGATGVVDYVGDYIFDERLVLVGEDGAKWGAGEKTAFIAEGKYWVNNHAHVLRCKQGILVDSWLANFLTMSDLNRYVSGLTVPKLNQGSLVSIEIPVPSLDEQKRIVELLDTATARVAELTACYEQACTHANNLFTSALRDALEINSEWPVKTLGEVCEFQNGYAFRSSEYVKKGHALIRIKNVQQGEILPSDDVFVQIPKDGSLDQFVLKAGDILMSLTGYLGRVGRLEETDLPAALNQRVAKVGVKPKALLFDGFLYRVLDSQWFRDQVEVYGRGAAQQNVGTSDISKIEIPVPPLGDQKQIVARLDSMRAKTSEMVAAYDAKLTAAKNLRQSILEAAFAGDL